MDTVGKNESETEVVRLEMLELARSAIQQYTTKFKRDGIEKSELETMLGDIESITSDLDTDLELKETILGLLDDTKADVVIAYETGKGGTE